MMINFNTSGLPYTNQSFSPAKIEQINQFLRASLIPWPREELTITQNFQDIKTFLELSRSINILSFEDLIEKVKAAKEQREQDEELYGSDIPEDANSSLLKIVQNSLESLNYTHELNQSFKKIS